MTNRPVELLILQATSFCNIDCGYCYLPNRSDRTKMQDEVAFAAIDRVFEYEQQKQPFTIVFHVGEPLAAGKSFFHNVANHAKARRRDEVWATFNVQTNGTLIDQEWCDLFKEHGFRVGISLDGPEPLHDAFRVDRRGKGSFEKVMLAIELLHRNDIAFHILGVLSSKSYDYADEIYDFFASLDPTHICFNVDEVEGANRESTTFQTDEENYANFWRELCDRWIADNMRLEFRELNGLLASIVSQDGNDTEPLNQMSQPFSIVTVSANGDFSTFSPELMAAPANRFVYGNVLNDSLSSVLHNEKLLIDSAAILAGNVLCRNTCGHFSICRGGSPSNKFYEHGRLNVSETENCRYTKKILADTVVSQLEKALL